MSDGPHKSLPMTKGWQRVAERADKRAYSLDQIAEAMGPALERDFRADVSSLLISALRELFAEDRQITLFGPESSIDRIEALRPQAAGHPLGNTLLDCAAESAAHGLKGEAAVNAAVRDAMAEHAQRSGRQMEEHYLRECSTGRAVDVRGRLIAAIQLVPTDKLSARILGMAVATAPAGITKYAGLDDGVPL